MVRLSLQKRISFLVLTALAIGLGLFSWLGVQAVNESITRTLEERRTIALVIANHVDQTLNDVGNQLGRANFNNQFPDRETFSAMANSSRQALEMSGVAIPAIILVSREGKVVQLEPNVTGLLDSDMYVYPEVKRTMETGLPTVSGLTSTAFNDKLVVLVSVPLLDKDKGVIGALTGVIDTEQSKNDAFSPTMTVGKTGYTEIVDGNGMVLARSSPGSPPLPFEQSDHPARFAKLIKEGKAVVGTCHRCHEAGNTVERRRDVLAFVPLSNASWGIAIRQSEEEALAPTQNLERRLIFLGMIIMLSIFAVVWMIMQDIVRPIRLLTAVAKKIAAGDMKATIPVKRRDEIGELSAAFQTMTGELSRSRDELVSRNKEMSALNSIAAIVSQSLNLEDVLSNAMQKILEVTKTTSGCIFLHRVRGNKLEMVNRVGPPALFECGETSSTNCACYQAMRSGETLMVNHVSQCPMLGENVVREGSVDCFISVPLKSKTRVLGVMNVACSREHCFTENDLRLLDAIGYHVELAIENSMLYEEAKLKEKLRGQLLNRLITAQEEERKRISRELHDEYGQTLTGLIMSVESIEDVIPPEQHALRDKLKNTKGMVDRALDDMRRLTHDLRPSMLDDLGLATASRAYARDHLEPLGIRLKFVARGLNRRLSPAVETTLFRIIQEAVHNIIKHAEAHAVRIRLEVADSRITTDIEDDGKGFDVDTFYKSRIGVQSLGILGMQERVALVDGTFTIKSQPGEGTHLRIEIPVAGIKARARTVRSMVRRVETGGRSAESDPNKENTSANS